MSEVISSGSLLEIWQGNRRLTRRVIEAFPEKELFEFSIGGMRPFSELAKELLAIAVPGLTEIAGGDTGSLSEDLQVHSKAELLQLWDEATEGINGFWPRISPERFGETIRLFGQYENTVTDSIFYFIENEIHHRGQGYVYLRALGIQPPFFWER
ncbi:DinB family protein [Leadbetterella sp. DM7]|uniref:DinB family protein n=1 Tax=Leadbetterella sp. DM7 TaxID=3235085 RepID=UPI00349EE55A